MSFKMMDDMSDHAIAVALTTLVEGCECAAVRAATSAIMGFKGHQHQAEIDHTIARQAFADFAIKLFNNGCDLPAKDPMPLVERIDKLRFIARVLESDAPREDRDAAARMARELRVRAHTEAQSVPVPTTHNMATMMIKIGSMWLEQHAKPSKETA